MKTTYLSILIVIFLLLCSVACQEKSIKLEVLIQNGIVYNGIDSIPQKVSIGIRGDKIVFVGDESNQNIETQKTIDAKGLVVAPGFIDPHTHADRDIKNAEQGHNLPFLMQGITTVVVGNDGKSLYPTEEFKKKYATQGIGTNVVMLTGHGTLRKMVVGESDRKATEEEITTMQALLQKEMEQGSFGLSTGLFYTPGSYGDTKEVIALSKIAAQYDGIYDTHLRDESSYTIGLKAAVEEAIEIGRQAKLPIHISHIKCLGVDVWGQSEEIIQLIEQSRKEGIDVTANQYPYDASATSLKAATVPRWAESGGIDSLFIRYQDPSLTSQILEETQQNIRRRGGADKLLIVKTDDSTYLGKNLLEVSELLQLSPEAAVFEVLKTGAVRVASFNMTTADIHNFMKQPWVVTGSDGNTGHPRKYGSFPRKYHQYVKKENVIDLAIFINNSSSKTAEIFKIPHRGKIVEGYFADIILFHPDTFQDKATYTDAFQVSEGLMYSFINGKLAVENGTFNEKRNGVILVKE